MSARHLEALRLQPERADRARRFLTSYAELCLNEFDESQESAVEPLESSTGNDLSPMRWGRLAEAASSYFEAGQWAMLTDPQLALQLWRRAGELYRRLDFGFGYYLHMTIIGAQDVPSDHHAKDAPSVADRMWERLRAVMVASHTVDEELERPVPVRLPEPARLPEPLRHPQQQTYLVLAGASVAGARDWQEFSGMTRGMLYSLVLRSPHYDGVTPVGALGVPIRTLWHMAAMMIEPNGDSVEQVTAIIGGLARRYDDTMQQAMANDYLWQNAAAPVDVGSFDIASIAMNAYRAFGPDRVEGALERILGGVPPIGRGQIEMALELARAADEEGWPQ